MIARGIAILRDPWRLLLIILALLALPWLAVWSASQFITPISYSAVHDGWIPSEAWLLDRHGQLLSSQRQDHVIRRLAWTRLDEVSPALIRAILLAEDRRFF